MTLSGARRGVSIGIWVVLSSVSASVVALMPVVQASAAPSVSVFVGYGVNAGSRTEFPSPWSDSSKVIFDGCTPLAACTFDAGAVRVRNDGGTSVTVDQISVHIGTCLYTWAGPMYPVTLAPGISLVTTQRGSEGVGGCTGPDPVSFDSSDLPRAGNCVPNGVVATVDVTVDGLTTSYADSGQVLNTGGIDPVLCTGVDETTQWVRIGERACPGQTLTLAPPSQTVAVTTEANLQATFANTCGSPLPDVVVNFNVTAGPNAGLTASGITDENGVAGLTYSSSKPGTDSIEAGTTNAVGFARTSNSAQVIWEVPFAPGGGAFVIGDRNAAVGNTVKFWGAQWAKENSLSGGSAPRSFKGFAEQPSVPDCGESWATDPGNSPPPPPGPLPDLMAVVVTSSAHKSGPGLSGDIVAIVIVRTNPGYAPNPGHSATGTVLAVMCGNLATAATPAAPRPNPVKGSVAAGRAQGALLTEAANPASPTMLAECAPPIHGQARGNPARRACSQTQAPGKGAGPS